MPKLEIKVKLNPKLKLTLNPKLKFKPRLTLNPKFKFKFNLKLNPALKLTLNLRLNLQPPTSIANYHHHLQHPTPQILSWSTHTTHAIRPPTQHPHQPRPNPSSLHIPFATHIQRSHPASPPNLQ